MTRVAFLTAVARRWCRLHAARAYDPATTHAGADRARGARVGAAPRSVARAVAPPGRVRARWAVARRVPTHAGAGARGAAGDASTHRRAGSRRPRRHRARAGLDRRWIRHRHHAGRARPAFLLRPEPGQRTVAGRRAGVAGEHARSVARFERRLRALFAGTIVQHDRAAVDGVAARARERRGAGRASRGPGGGDRRGPPAAARDRARARLAGAGRRADDPRRRRRAGPRPQ